MAGNIRIGIVSSVDIARMAIRAVIPDQDNLVTDWLPIVQPFSGIAGLPSVDDMVLCAFVDSGLENGFCLGKVGSS